MGAHPFGDVTVRVEVTAYGGVCRRRVGSGGRQRPRGAPAARDRRGGEARRTDSGRKMAGAVLTGKVATTTTMAWIPARSIALRRRHWTRGERGKWGGGGVKRGPIGVEKEVRVDFRRGGCQWLFKAEAGGSRGGAGW
jgi:hypothetical protein